LTSSPDDTARPAAGTDAPPRALDGIRVLDLTQVLAGPYCSQILADFGADVIKVEPPGRGDQSRATMGPKLKGADRAGFLAVNRNKRSITLDLKSEQGRAAFDRLVATADVLLENFRPGVADRLGIGYPALHAKYPNLVYASISGFGETGPFAPRAGYDLIAQAATGIMSITGEPGGRPVKCGLPICDLTSGLFAAIGILVACRATSNGAPGQHVETSLYDAGVGLSLWEAVAYWATGEVPEPLGSAHRLTAPYQALRTGKGFVTVAGNNDRSWRALCKVVDRPELADDARFANNDLRMTNLPELVAELESALAARTADEWVELMLAEGIACSPIRSYDEVLQGSHTRARGLVVEAPHPVEGTVKALATPVRMDGTPAAVVKGAPLLGEDTDDLLRSVGYDSAEIDRLRRDGVI
jgi:crotonobetainyl-CoA:carnitine CoA-transferase CaiB-like acyl-CoA transferase